MKILAVDAAPDSRKNLVEALGHDGWATVEVLHDASSLPHILSLAKPDIVLLHLQAATQLEIDGFCRAAQKVQIPVAIFVDHAPIGQPQEAVAAGVSAYVVGGYEMTRLRAILETALARFQVTRRLQDDLETANQALSDRKSIDRAKGALMQMHGLSENDAYALLRRSAMQKKCKIVELAEKIVVAADVLA